MKGFMKIANNEILLIYDSNDMQDRAVLAYAKSVENHVVKEIDIRSHTFTEVQFVEMADVLDVTIIELIDQASETFRNEYQGVELTDQGALTALKKNSDLLKTPVALYNDSGNFDFSSYDLIQKGMIKE